MQKKLSLLLLYYQESPETAKPMLDSIENQTSINWENIEILICSSSLEAYELDLTNYPNIKSVSKRVKQNTFVSGPGASWRLGILNASGEYLWKINIDDNLYNNLSLYNALNCLDYYRPLSPDLIHISYINNGTAVITNKSNSWSMAPWAWLMKREFLINNTLLPNEYLATKEDINFFGLLANWLIGKPFYANQDILYNHIDNHQSVTHGINRDYFRVCKENYYHFIDNCKYYEERNIPYSVQLSVNFVWQWWLNAQNITDCKEQRVVSHLTKMAIKKYPALLIPELQKDDYKKLVNKLLYNYVLFVNFTPDITLGEFKETLMAIQCQTLNEDTYFDVTRLQLVVWGDIPDEVRDYDYSVEYPLLNNNLIFTDAKDADKARIYSLCDKSGMIDARLILQNNTELYRYFIKGETE